ncbi:unnamed protein product, partial [Didymodactylos carnosus]
HGKKFVKERFPRLEELYLDDNKLVEDELFIYLACLKNLKRLHLQRNQIRTIPFLKVLQGRQIVQEFSKAAIKRKQLATQNSMTNIFQRRLSGTGDELMKSTIVEEDEATMNIPEEEELSIELPAFPELQYLDLSSNLIEEEDDVMAVASWPCLTEMLLTDNPLIRRNVGLPPLVESFLIDRLGIKVHRTEPPVTAGKQLYTKPVKRHRKVSSVIPKVPKVPVDVMLSGAVKQYIDYVKDEKQSEDFKEKLSALPAPQTPSGEQSSEDMFKSNTFQTEQTLTNNDECDGQKRFETFHSQFIPNERTQSSSEQHENIFMTQFDNEDLFIAQNDEKGVKTERLKSVENQLPVDERFKGYEIFLNIDNEEEIVVPKIYFFHAVRPSINFVLDVLGCVRQLKQILRNPLIVRDNVQMQKKQRAFVPKYTKHTLPPLKRNRPRVEEISQWLDNMRDRKTIIEQPLVEMLNADKKSQKVATTLVAEVQKHYESVRSASLRAVKTPGTILDDALHRLQRFDTNISSQSRSTRYRLTSA